VQAELFQRYAGNPILTAANWSYPIHSVFNPGAIRLASGETLLPMRAEDRRGISHLTAARSHDGITSTRSQFSQRRGTATRMTSGVSRMRTSSISTALPAMP
jgi:predicted GH43/DUF377 family glycosyl hydrolase